MKVLFIHDNKYYPDKDSDVVYTVSQSFSYVTWMRYLKVFDHITVVGRKDLYYGDRAKLCESSGENVDFIFTPSVNSIPDFFENYRKSTEIVKNALEDCDCLIARLPSSLGFIAVREAMKMKKPWAIEVVSCAFDAYKTSGYFLGNLYAPVAYFLNKDIIKKAHFALYVTRSFLQKRYPSPFAKCVGCSNVELLSSGRDVINKRLAKIKKGFQDKIIFGLIGPLSLAYKGHITALKALKELNLKNGSYEIRFLGEGDGSKLLKSAEELGISDKVRFCGILKGGADVMKWLDDIDIFLCPSLIEGLPRALIEAMSRGCPSIGSNAGGIGELINSEFLHDPKDYKALAKLIEQMTSDQETMMRCARENFIQVKYYEKSILDRRRTEFYRTFKKYVERETKTDEKADV